MSTKIENLRDLFIMQAREFYDASKQEIAELPRIHQRVSSTQLKKVLNQQLDLTKNHKVRFQHAFNKMNASPEGEKNHCCESTLKQINGVIDRSLDNEVRDAAIISSMQRLNHTKIASLGALASYSKQLGFENEITNSFHEALTEEKNIDKKLTDIAESDINKKALMAVA